MPSSRGHHSWNSNSLWGGKNRYSTTDVLFIPDGSTIWLGHPVAQLVEALGYELVGHGALFTMVAWYFRSHYGPGIDSASNRNENQEYILGVKVDSVYGWPSFHFNVPTVLKFGSIRLLDTSGPVQDCNGRALCSPLVPWLERGLDDRGTISDFYMHKGFTLSLKYTDHTRSHKASFTIGTGGYSLGSKVTTTRMGKVTFI